MASLGEVNAAIAAACDKASKCKDALGTAGDLAEDAQAVLGSALEGDTTGDKDKVLASLQAVVDGVRELWKVLSKGVDHAQAALDAIRGTGAPPPEAPSRPPSAAQPPAAPASPPPPLPPERVEELLRDLPPAVIGGTGQKTHGRWTAPDGSTQRAVSGHDEWTPKVNAALAAEGCPRLPVVTDADVELKLAARMREQGTLDPAMRHLTLALNYAPCVGPFGCDSLLPAVLPEGYTLAVYGPDGYYKKFTGGKPPWRR